jgi:hypothetical protein
MAGSVVTNVKSNKDGIQIGLTLTSDASGDCDVGTFTAHGYLVGMIVEPSSAADPTNEFDIVVNDSSSLDVLNGAGANLLNDANKTVAGKYIHPQGPNGNYLYFFGETLTLVASNMGNAKVATIKLQFSRRIP